MVSDKRSLMDKGGHFVYRATELDWKTKLENASLINPVPVLLSASELSGFLQSVF